MKYMKKIKESKKPIVWSISGSDCSGGAGIAADIKTGHSLSVEVCHLITANTVQNSKKLMSINPVDIDILAQQYETLLFDKPPQAIKVGLLANQTQVTWLVEILQEIKRIFPKTIVIYDPVGQASVGGNLTTLATTELHPLFDFIDVITPNLHEAKILSGENQGDIEVSILAEKIRVLGVNSVIIKGGHTNINSNTHDNDKTLPLPIHNTTENCIDYCLHTLTDNDSSKMSTDEIIEYALISPRINTHHSHGGGCSFASALAAFCAHGYLLRDAFTLTKAFMQQGLKAFENKNDNYGAFEQTTWPIQASSFPDVQSNITTMYQDLPPFESLNLLPNESLGIYPIVDSLAWLERLLPLNINIIQLRIKDTPPEDLDSIIQQAIMLAKYHNTRLFINDYWELAIKYDAYGVHIGQEDLINADLAEIQKAGLCLGISTHGCYEFLLAQQLHPSYLAIGAIFPTKTKDMSGQIQGVDNLKDNLLLKKDIPIVAIGGINLERAVDVWRTGVDSIAIVTGITEANEPELAVRLFQAVMN